MCFNNTNVFFFFFFKEKNHLFEILKRKPMNTQQVKETTQESLLKDGWHCFLLTCQLEKRVNDKVHRW